MNGKKVKQLRDIIKSDFEDIDDYNDVIIKNARGEDKIQKVLSNHSLKKNFGFLKKLYKKRKSELDNY